MTKDQLLPQELRERLPQLDEINGEQAIAQVKYFFPDFPWTWYGIAFDGDDIFYGFVDGDHAEFGPFSLRELMRTRGMLGCAVERDLHFEPTRVRDLPEYQRAAAKLGLGGH